MSWLSQTARTQLKIGKWAISRRALIAILALAGLLALAAQAAPMLQPRSGPTGLSVFAASSLKEAFTESGRNFRAANPNITDPRFNFQGSQALVAQLQQGAPADVFASADKTNMDKAVQAG